MEKGNTRPRSHVVFIVLTGPECTGKSTLAKQLAAYYHAVYIPEYAREYIQNLCRPYNYEDILHIAATQVRQKNEQSQRPDRIVFLDTYLVITKVWMDLLYKTHPAWIEEELRCHGIGLYLLCNLDIAWEPDRVRENGGQMREKLFNLYKHELEQYDLNYEIISGIGAARLQQAIRVVDILIKSNEKALNQ
jgi:nicotinamide riboside kinase